MKSPVRVSLALLILLAFAIPANAADPMEIRAGTDLEFRPWSFIGQDGQPTGFGVELLQAVAEKATLRLHLSLGEWNKVWSELVAGEIDVLPAVARTPNREGLVEFSLPHTETFDAFFVRTGQPPIRDLVEAAGKEIVVVRSDAANHQLVAREFPGKIVPVDSIPEGLRLIASGKHDAMLCSRLIGVLERDQSGIRGVTDGPMIPDYKRVFSFGVRKGNTELVERLNQGLRLIQADGTYDRLYRKWLGPPAEPLATWRDHFWQVIAAIGMLSLLAATLGVGRKVLQMDSRPLPASTSQPRRTSAVAMSFALAPLTVAAAFIVHSGLLEWIDAPLPPFLLFYPAMMGVAVIAGLWPGLLATTLSALVVAVWIMEPVGRLSIASPAELLALGIFFLNGLLMCAVAQLYRRSRSKAVDYERHAAVRESEERLRLLGDNLPDSIVYQQSRGPDGESSYLHISAGVERIRGIKPHDALSDAGVLRRQILPEYHDKVNNEEKRSFEELSDFDMEIPVRLPDGEVRWMRIHSRPRRTPDGSTVWDGVQTDITEWKASEEALKRHSSVLKAINRILEMGLGKQKVEEMCQACLSLVEEVTGSAISFIGEIRSDGFLHPLAVSNPGWNACDMYNESGHRKPPGKFPWRGIYGRVMSDGKSLIVNDPSSHPDRIGLPQGHPPLTAFLGVPLMREGKVVGMIAVANREGGYHIQDQECLEAVAPAFIQAIDRKGAEEALRESERRERERAGELQALLEAAPTPIFIASDSDCRHISGNRAAAELLRHPYGSEASLSAAEGVRPQHFKAFRQGRELRADELPAQRAAKGEQVKEFEFSLVFQDGEVRQVLGYGTPLFDERGHSRGAVHILVDITAHKQAEEELRRLNENLEARVQERTERLRKLASELTLVEQRERKNLSKVLHDGLQQYIVAAKMQLNSLHTRIQHEGKKQEAQAIEQLLDDAVQVSRNLAAELSPPILRDAGILAGLEWLSRWMLDKHGLKVQLVMEMDAPALADDVKILLFESVREMLLNIVKHAGTKSAKVHLFQAESDQLGLTVSDNGRGFDIDPANAHNHQGFGLFSIQERLSLMGGKLVIDSAVGNGARLTMIAPLAIPEPLDSAPTASAASAPVTSQGKLKDGRIKVLLVDDHPVLREGLARLLAQEADLEVVGQAANGQEAIEKAAAYQPECILMDVSMPVLGGIEATEILHRQHPSIRIIGLSLYTEDERAKEMLAAGASFYMSKSGPPSELISAIRSCCGRESSAVSYLRKDQAAKLN